MLLCPAPDRDYWNAFLRRANYASERRDCFSQRAAER
jgi:hypothetical protein